MHKLNDQPLAYRYDVSNFIRRTEKNDNYFDIVDSEFLFRIKKLKNLRVFVVTIEANRPDLLSEAIYGEGNHQLWWILMFINNLRLPTDIKTGMVIQYPTLDQLENIYFSLTASSVVDRLKSTTELIERLA